MTLETEERRILAPHKTEKIRESHEPTVITYVSIGPILPSPQGKKKGLASSSRQQPSLKSVPPWLLSVALLDFEHWTTPAPATTAHTQQRTILIRRRRLYRQPRLFLRVRATVRGCSWDHPWLRRRASAARGSTSPEATASAGRQVSLYLSRWA